MKKIYFLFICSLVLFSGCDLLNKTNSNGNANSNNQNINSQLSDIYYGQIVVSGKVIRDNGEGTCGISPWSGGCTISRNWWGLELRANAYGDFLIIPDGEGRWVLTNIPETLDQYTYLGVNSDDFNQKNGNYSSTEFAGVDFSSTPGCEGNIKLTGDHFNTQVMGTAKYNYINITLSPQATERITGSCGVMANFDSETSFWRYGVSAIVSGDPNDMTILLGPEDYKPEGISSPTNQGTTYNNIGYYIRQYTGDTNPSPQNRDHVTVLAQLQCYSDQGRQEEAICPWNK